MYIFAWVEHPFDHRPASPISLKSITKCKQDGNGIFGLPHTRGWPFLKQHLTAHQFVPLETCCQTIIFIIPRDCPADPNSIICFIGNVRRGGVQEAHYFVWKLWVGYAMQAGPLCRVSHTTPYSHRIFLLPPPPSLICCYPAPWELSLLRVSRNHLHSHRMGGMVELLI